MKISKLYKLLCFVLIVALAANIALVPISTAHAQGPVQNQQISLNKITDSIKVNEKAEYASTDNEKYTELTDKRTEYLKYYQLESKRYEAVSFGLPVHYLEDGKYQDIDNSLHLVTEKDGKQKYTNKANSFKAELTPVIDGDWIGSIIKDKYKVSWTIEGIKTGKSDGSSSIEQSEADAPSESQEDPIPENTTLPEEPPTESPTLTEELATENTPLPAEEPTTDKTSLPEETPAVENTPAPTKEPVAETTPLPEEDLPTDDPIVSEELTALAKGKTAVAETLLTKAEWLQMNQGDKRRNVPNISSDVTYKDVLPGIDLQYLVISDRIKENLIINNKTDITEITQRLMAEGGLTLSQEKDGSIIAYDSAQNAVFKMQTPYMMDKSGNGCNIVSELVEADGEYFLTYKLDQDWLKNAAYPVIIDPTITTSLDPSDIDDTRIASGLPTNNYTLSYIMSTGYGSTSGINYSLVKFNNMPVIGPSEMVVYAGFRVKRASSSSINSTVNAHEITSSWNSSTVTWNTKPTFNSNIEDYNIVDTVAGKTWEWDITRIAKNWYSGSANNGILLKDVSDTGGYKEWYTTNATYGDVPYAYFVYTDYAGMEGYWDYTSSSVGRGGTANVNLYNGNMIYTHSDLEMNGNRMPIAIAHVFNSTSRNVNDSKMLYGKGWRTNFDQRVSYVTITGTNYYKYIDEDGTAHYFVLKDGVWKAEDGIDLKLSVGGGNAITITDKTDNKLVFYPVADANKPGFLNYIEDSNGNRQTVGYDGNHRINQITDGAGRVVQLTRKANGYLEKIRQPIDATNYRETVFSYDANNRLVGIQYPDSNSTTIAYDANGNLTSATNFDGKKTTITYQPAAPYRVTQLEESNGATMGGKLNFAYGYNRTEITDVEGRKAQYQFNDGGNTVCVIGPDGSAAYSKFGKTANGATTNDINKVILSSKQQKFGVNYLLNHNMESSSTWTMNSFFGSVGTHTYGTDQKYYGAKSIKLTKSNTDGYERASQTMTLTKGKTYTLSGYIKTSDVTSSTSGAYMRVLYNTASGQEHVNSPVLKGTNDWDRYSVTFTIPADASSGSASVYLDLMESTGSVWFDSLQLEEGSVVNRYNLIENADFTSYSGNTPSFWVRDNLTASDTVDTSADSGNPSYMSDTRFKINGDCTPGNWKSIDQTIPVSGNTGDSYVVGGWAKGTSVPMAKDSAYRVFGLSVEFKYTDGTNEYLVVNFNEDSSIWQYASGAVVAKKNYNSIVVRPHYSGEANTAWFDGIQLYREEFGESYSYDAEGNLKSAKDLEKKEDQFQYTNNDLTKHILPDQRDYDYTYDSHHNLLTATSPMSLTYTYTYDANGNQTSAKIGDSTDYIRTTANYTSSKNYVDYITNPFGEVIDYNFNEYTGTLDSVIDPLGHNVNHTYDSDTNRLEQTSAPNGGSAVSNDYSYTNDRLAEVSHNAPNSSSVSFSFTYNGLGWITETKVGNQTFSTYDLAARTGLINSTSYGNGQTINYEYDSLDRLTGVSQDGSDLYTYEYNNSGNIGYQNDSVNNKEYWYSYDSMERLGKVTSKDSSGNIGWSKYGFDTKNNLTSFIEKIGGIEYNTSYTYDNDDRPDTATFGTGSIDITYDSTLGVITDIARKVSSNTVYNTSYGYTPGDGTTSTKSNQVQTITNGNETLTYTYDERGLITQVQLDENNLSQYRYDTLGELVRENYKWGASVYTIIYAYDVGGNITSKTKYAYVAGDGQVGTPIDTVAYTYDATWKDKLVSYDGNTITYDEIGNPLSDGTWTYTWTQGRRLQQVADGITTASYKYNDSGIRTEKTINGTTTKYNLVGDNITWQKTGSDTPIYFVYDAGDKLWGLKYTDGNTYFYVRNAQGDIIKIVNSSGTIVVEYAYDAWGSPVSTTGTMASTLGTDNPFRYRGYYYDEETGLYYLNQRYYNPEWGRFINADTLTGQSGDLLGHNLFAYCQNNPAMMYDPSGRGGIFSMLDSLVNGNEGGFWGALVSTVVVVAAVVVVGALTGGVGAVAIAGAVAGFAGSVGGQAIEDAVNGDPITIDYGEAVIDGVYGAAGGAAGQAMFGAAGVVTSTFASLTTVGIVGDGFDYLTDAVIDKNRTNSTKPQPSKSTTSHKVTNKTTSKPPKKTLPTLPKLPSSQKTKTPSNIEYLYYRGLLRAC